jgi:hypothetical protein
MVIFNSYVKLPEGNKQIQTGQITLRLLCRAWDDMYPLLLPLQGSAVQS